MSSHAHAGSRFIRIGAVAERTGLSPTTIWRLRRIGEFPQSARISPGVVAWLESDVEQWIADRAGDRERR